MGLTDIKLLSANSHFYSDIILSFLCGYEDECDIKKIYLILPIIFDEDSREKLIRASAKSRLETVICEQKTSNGKLSALSRVNSLDIKYNFYRDKTSRALIVLTSEAKATYKEYKIKRTDKIDYKRFDYDKKDLLRCAFYLGKIFKKVDINHIATYLGVDY